MRNRICQFIILVLMTSMARSQTCEEWLFRQPQPQGNPLSRMVYYDGYYWSVGKFGVILKSQDGLTWEQLDAGTTEHLNDIIFAWELTVVGDHGLVLTSLDGQSWNRPAQLPASLHAIAYANGTFVAMGEGDKVYSCSFLNSWHEWNKNSTRTIYDIIHDGTQFVAVGGNGTFMTSANGQHWTTISQLNGKTTEFRSINLLNGLYVITGDEGTILTSEDLAVWSDVSIPGASHLNGSFITDGQYAVVGSSCYTSLDGAQWIESQYFDFEVIGLCQNGVQTLACTYGGRFYRTINGSDWSLMPGSLTWNNLWSITYGAGRFITTTSSYGNILTSLDGSDWSEISTGNYGVLHGVATIDDTLIAVGDQGFIMSSEDGVNWTELSSPTTGNLREIGTNGSTSVIVGQNVILYSTDLVDWNLAINHGANDDFLSVTHGWDGLAGRFVAVGYNGTILHSPDGITWSPAADTGPPGSHLLEVTANGARFVAIGTKGTVMTSLFGHYWTLHDVGISSALYHVLYDGRQYRIFGDHQVYFTSADSLTWQSMPNPIWNLCLDSTMLDGRIILTGTNGQIVEISPYDLPTDQWPHEIRVPGLIEELGTHCE